MIGRAAQVVEVEDDDLAAGHGDVAVGGEAADAIVNGGRRRRVVDVDELVGREVRIEGDAEQAALADGVDGECKKRRRQQRAVLDDAQPAALLGDEEAAVGRELHRGRTRQAARDERFGEPVGHRRRLHRRSGKHRDQRDQAVREQRGSRCNAAGLSSDAPAESSCMHSQGTVRPRECTRERAARRSRLQELE